MASTKKPARAPGRTTPPVSVERSTLDTLRELVAVLEGSSLTELSFEDAELAVRLVRGGSASAALPIAHPAPLAAPAPAPIAQTQTPAPAADTDLVVVRSPFVGTFYRAPKPGLPAFTEVGQRVRRGQTLCIIEAMKLMNEIESEIDGTVVDVLVENNHAVQYGDALFKLRKG